MAVYDNRICIRCKRQFRGGPRAWYCPTCREDRRRERERKYAGRPSKRPLGSTDICQSCGAEYIVCSGLQKYCPDCQPIKYRELDAAQGVKYHHTHYATEKERNARSKRRRARYAANKDEINRKRREKRAQKKKEKKSIMKRIIKNKVYDTDTAQRLGEYAPNPYRSDFSYFCYFCETLYRKKTGEFFLHGEGNAASKYSRSCGQNEWCGDEKIVPLTYEEAQAWAEKHLDGDDYIAIFGEPEEDGSVEALNVRISSARMTKLRQAASRKGLTLVALVEKLIDSI